VNERASIGTDPAALEEAAAGPVDFPHKISVTVNGRREKLTVQSNRRLIELLREDLGLIGTKEGCSVGVCGACTVLLNGRSVSGCLTLAVTADGGDIQTIEGLAEGGKLHPIQQAFLDKGGLQCGFCTPGQVMATKALLEKYPDPTEEQIKHMMMGNLCRCTGYYMIMDSIKAAAFELKKAEA